MYITKLKGVGKKTAHLLLNENINTVVDLINLTPTYENYSLSSTDRSNHNNIITIQAVISSDIKQIITPRAKFVKFNITYNNSETLEVYAFNQLFLMKTLKYDLNITIKGKFDYYLKRITAHKILLKQLDDNNNFISKYRVGDIPSGRIRNLIKYSLDNYSNLITDNLPPNFINHFNLANKINAFKYLHFPKNLDEINKALKRFKYEEAYLNEKLLQKELRTQPTRKEIPYNIDLVKNEISKIPFELTNDQKLATNQIFTQFKTINPLSHIITGDVGTGKTIVASLAAIGMISGGYQVAFMAPTEILAKQHYKNFIKTFKGFNASLLTSKIKNRKTVLENIKNNKTNIVFGTHSLISDEVKFHNIGLAIIDEQHKFGVSVRNQLKEKRRALDFIYLSATPIPRSLEMALTGFINLIQIDDKPKGRIPVKTEVINESNLDEVILQIKNNQLKNQKTYIVVPAINTDRHQYTIDELLPILNKTITNDLYVIHGNQSKDDQQYNLEGFSNSNNAVLLATSIIEVGVDDPLASLMVIIGANYFGLSALHQLRGRVGRGNIQSYCLLITENEEDERLQTLITVSEGLKLAEIDLKLRGFGSLLGFEQSGFLKYRYLDITSDNDVIKNVRSFLTKR